MATPPEFTSGAILTAAQMNAVGMWLVNSTSFTNTTTIQINNCFTSDYRNYLVMVSMGCQTEGTGSVDIRLRASGANTTAGNYFFQGVTQNVTTSPTSNAGSGTNFYGSNVFLTDETSTTMEIKFFNPQVSTSHTGIHNSTFFTFGDSYFYRNALGTWKATGSYDGFSLIPSRAVTGRLRVYGLRD
jgi:hypothetical protein